MHTVRIATNPRKWRRPAPCPACRQSQPLILTLGAVCIAPEDDEERQACEIAVNALLRWSAEHDKEKEQQ